MTREVNKRDELRKLHALAVLIMRGSAKSGADGGSTQSAPTLGSFGETRGGPVAVVAAVGSTCAAARKRFRCTSSVFGARRTCRVNDACLPPHVFFAHRRSTVSGAKHLCSSACSGSGEPPTGPSRDSPALSSRLKCRHDSVEYETSPHKAHVSVTLDAPVNARRVGHTARCKGTIPLLLFP